MACDLVRGHYCNVNENLSLSVYNNERELLLFIHEKRSICVEQEVI